MRDVLFLLRYTALQSLRLEYAATIRANPTRVLLQRALVVLVALVLVNRFSELIPAILATGPAVEVVLFHIGLLTFALFGLQSFFRRTLTPEEAEFLHQTGYHSRIIALAKYVDGIAPVTLYYAALWLPCWLIGIMTGRLRWLDGLVSLVGAVSAGLTVNTVTYLAASLARRFLSPGTVEVLGRAFLLVATMAAGLLVAVSGRSLGALIGLLAGERGVLAWTAAGYGRWLGLVQRDFWWFYVPPTGAVLLVWLITDAVSRFKLQALTASQHEGKPTDLRVLRSLVVCLPAAIRPYVLKDLQLWCRDSKRWANSVVAMITMVLLMLALLGLMRAPAQAYRLVALLVPVIWSFSVTVLHALPLVHQDQPFLPHLRMVSASLQVWLMGKFCTVLAVTLPFSTVIGVVTALVPGLSLLVTMGVALGAAVLFSITGLAAAVVTLDPTADEAAALRPAVLLAGAVLIVLLSTLTPIILNWQRWDAGAKLTVALGFGALWAWILVGSVVVTLHRVRRFEG